MASHVIRPIPLCLSALPRESKLYRASPGVAIPVAISTFYIEGAKKNILVDSGASALDFIVHGLFNYRHVQTMQEGLAKLGLKPEDIDLIIQTHLHVDHVFYAPIFPKTKFLVQKAEFDYHRNPPPVDPRPCDKKLLDL